MESILCRLYLIDDAKTKFDDGPHKTSLNETKCNKRL